MLKVVSLAAAHDGDLLFSGFDLILGDGDRIGVVGPNGAGKTTLLRLLAGELLPADGSVTAGPGTRVGYVPQQMPDPDDTVADFPHGGLGELAAVTRDLRALERQPAAGEDVLGWWRGRRRCASGGCGGRWSRRGGLRGRGAGLR